MNARFSYREAAIRGASPVRLVICLYEQVIEDLRHAVMAIQEEDIQARTRAINHALTVIGQLQGTLNMEHGGDVAKNLQQFYDILRAGLIEAQGKQSAAIVEQQIALLIQIHEAWLEVERTAGAPAQATQDLQQTPLSISSPESSPEPRASDWSA